MADLEPLPIPGTDLEGGIANPVFSPDGESLALWSSGALKTIPVRGGTPVTICPAENVEGMTWDSSGIVFGQHSGIYRCPATGGLPEQLVKVEENERPYGPQILPGGDSVLFSLGKANDDTAERWDKASIVVQSLTTGTRKTLVEGGSDGRYIHTGHLVYAVGGVVYASPFDLGRQEVTGGPVGVVEGVRRAVVTGATQLHTSGNGTLLYVPGPTAPGTRDRAIAVADRTGIVTRLRFQAGLYEHVRASRDGKRIVLDSDDGKDAVVWVHELTGTSAPTRLTFTGRNRYPILAPDGQRVAFQSDREGDRRSSCSVRTARVRSSD